MTQGLIVDGFCGGGGASEGFQIALGRGPDIAINHDADAIAMHTANHPETEHFSKNIWKIDPIEAVHGQPVYAAWFSPDCTHHSKARGTKPMKRNIRDLAWVVVLWAKRARPNVIFLENVEEFQGWGPVGQDGRPCPERKGKTFKKFVGELRRLGYKVKWRESRACDYGDPTIRKRLILIARCDGQPIVFPKPTHGPADHRDVIAGKLQPYKTAADIIDWSLPCPSIFLTREEAKALYRATGIKCNRPLAEATMRRIAKGVMRYVIDAKEPFIVTCNHGGEEFRGQGLDEPFKTVTASRDAHGLIVPTLIQTGYGERPGQAPRVPGLEKPIGTQVAGGCKHAVVATYLQRDFGNSVGHGVDSPVATITPGGGGKAALVSAFLAQHNGGMVGHKAEAPLSTITQRGTNQQVVAAHMINMKGSDQRSAPADAPVSAICAQGKHVGLVSAFLTKYYGQGGQWSDPRDPAHTIRTKDCQALVTVNINGSDYAIVDIGMRMLTPRERFLAQGFRPDYIIDHGADGKPLTGEAQGRMCGNAVCPNWAAAHIRANLDVAVEERVAA